MSKINYQRIILNYPWILRRNQKAILSPDSDGLLCGLFMSHYFDWEIVGFYDGKILLLKNHLSAKDCIFLDMEIYRKDIRSMGHHMVLFNKENLPRNWNNFKNCIQPNIIRGYDAFHHFRLKYPLASIHFLLGLVGSKRKIKIKKSAICPLLYTNGTFKNLLNYPENCLSWLSFLRGDEEKSPIYQVFYNKYYLVSDLMISLKDFFDKLSNISKGKGRTDKLRISNSKGELINLTKKQETYTLDLDEKNKIERFLKVLSNLTDWDYKKDKWSWELFNIYKFHKGNIKPSNARYNNLIKKRPLSLAMTSGLAIEYTLERPDKLP